MVQDLLEHLVNKLIADNHKLMVVDKMISIGAIPFVNKNVILKGDILNNNCFKD